MVGWDCELTCAGYSGAADVWRSEAWLPGSAAVSGLAAGLGEVDAAMVFMGIDRSSMGMSW